MTFDPDRLPSEGSGHPTGFDYDCLVAGELPPDEARQLESHAADCDACGALLARSRLDPLDGHEASTLAAIRRGLETEPSGWRAWLSNLRMGWAMAGVAAVAAAALVFMVQRPDATPEHTVRSKGALQLHVLRKVEDGAVRVASGEAITPDDSLRFQITLLAPARVRVIGIEPDGTLYTAWPLDAAAPGTVWPIGKLQPLPGAVHLDGPSGVEHLYLVACPDGIADRCVSAGAGQPPKCAEQCATSGFSFTRP